MRRIEQIHECMDTLLMLRNAGLENSNASDAVFADMHELIRAEEATQNADAHEWPACWPEDGIPAGDGPEAQEGVGPTP